MGKMAEPLINVTQNFWSASVVTPEFERLEPHMMATRADDFILPLRSSNSVRAQFDFCISAFGSPITTYGWERGHFLWPNFYTLNLIVSDQPIPAGPSSENGFWFITPRKGLFKEQQISEESALISYHQRKHSYPGPIMYGPDQEGAYRLIFPVPALTEPRIITNVAKLGLTLEIMEVTRARASFRFRNRDGAVVKTPPEFERVELGDNSLIIHSRSA